MIELNKKHLILQKLKITIIQLFWDKIYLSAYFLAEQSQLWNKIQNQSKIQDVDDFFDL